MIIECESCRSKFRLDGSLVNERGSKVRCSVCKNAFTIYPTGEEIREESGLAPGPKSGDLRKTISLDGPPEGAERDRGIGEEDVSGAFDDFAGTMEGVFKQATDEIVREEEAVSDHPPELAEDEPSEMEEARQRATGEEEEVTRADQKKKVSKKVAKKSQSIAKVSAKKHVKRPPTAPAKPRTRPFLSLPLVGVGIVLLLAATVYFFKPELVPDSLSFLKSETKEDVNDPGIRRLAFKAVTGSFVQSNTEGQLFVVKGVVTNNYPHKRSFLLVKVTILDNKGDALKRRMVYAGNIFTTNLIKEMSVEGMNKALKNRSGKGDMNVNIPPGNSIPFMAIFDDLPENMSEFTVEAVSSAEGR